MGPARTGRAGLGNRSRSGLSRPRSKDGLSMKVDFSPKGGPKDVTGKWNGKDGITFPDGNTWTKLESTSLDVGAYPSKDARSTDLGKGGWSVDRLTKRMGGFY